MEIPVKYTFTERAKAILARAEQLTVEANQRAIEPAHILKAMLEEPDSVTEKILRRMGIDVVAVKMATDHTISTRFPEHQEGEPYYSADTQALLQKAWTAARDVGKFTIHVEELLIGDLEIGHILDKVGATRAEIVDAARVVRNAEFYDSTIERMQ